LDLGAACNIVADTDKKNKRHTMCGIIAILGADLGPADLAEARAALERTRHRGPDASNVLNGPGYVLGHNRLSIQGTHLCSAQPLTASDGAHLLSINGEIYNASKLGTASERLHADSDCSAVLNLLREASESAANGWIDGPTLRRLLARLDGVYSFVYLNLEAQQVVVARSRFGVMPLYYCRETEKSSSSSSSRPARTCFASERKALPKEAHVAQVPPGSYASFGLSGDPNAVHWNCFDAVAAPRQHSAGPLAAAFPAPAGVMDVSRFRWLLRDAVRKRVESVSPEVRLGFLLSGGLDSSAVVALARDLWPDRELLTFSIGLAGSPDLLAARVVAEHCKTEHHEHVFTVAEALEAVPQVIEAVETVDVTTVRASTPMWLLARHIKRDFPKLKVLLSGEGADELLGGYLCFHQAPSLEESKAYSLKLLRNLHAYDVQRAHHSLMAHSIEARVPFLDNAFTGYCLGLHPVFLTPVCRQEKYWLRRAVQDLLPPSIVTRTKEQFSDGVGYAWIDALREGEWHELRNGLAVLTEHRTAAGREQLNIFDLFLERFGAAHFKSICETTCNWKPEWSRSTDASGRVADMHPTRQAAAAPAT
jgi:asparagine synthase (glutamine-hydrolysing)